jgi:hypothetical protein
MVVILIIVVQAGGNHYKNKGGGSNYFCLPNDHDNGKPYSNPNDVLYGAEYEIKVITKLPNSEQSYKGKVKTHNYINRQNQSTTGKLCKP